MKFETLIKRYEKLGYTKRNLEDRIELECLINWIYEKYDLLIYLTCYDRYTIQAFNKVGVTVDKFGAHYQWNCNKEYSNTMYSEKHFKTPFEAKFDTVKGVYRAIKFQYH